MGQAVQPTQENKSGAAGNGAANGRAKGQVKALATLPGDAAEARSRQILAAMMAFSDGDFKMRLPSDWAGTDGRIAQAFNRTIGHAEHRKSVV